jgi:NAD(P)-dependent dehydrogenase (short-subunit alcohol dehydrogenase family)
MSSTPVLLLFGSGPNTGLATVRKFAKEGYKVAAVSRHPSDELKKLAHLIIPAILANPTQVEVVFEKVTKELGPPHVVVYNAYDTQIVSSNNPLDVSVERLTETLAVNTISPYTAAKLATRGWATLPDTASKTFMFTGNMMNTQVWLATHNLGISKNATAYWLEVAANVPEYKEKGYSFYYVDERDAEGETVSMNIDGEAHAVEFWRLSQLKEQSHWCWTFVKGTAGGYVRNKAAVDREVRDMSLLGLPEGGVDMPGLMKMMAAMQQGGQ